jgi:putative cell wall-binding protein
LSKSRFSWISGTLAVAMASAVIAFPPAAGAEAGKINLQDELLNARKRQVLQQINQIAPEMAKERPADRSSSSMKTQTAESVTFSGTVAPNEVHEYWLALSGEGTVDVQAGHAGDSVDYMIVRALDDSGTYYHDGDTLQPGYYLLVVFATGENPADYSYTLNGLTFSETPDTTLPRLTVTKPEAEYVRLPMDSARVSVAGSHDGTDTSIYYGAPWYYYPYRVEFGPLFSTSVPVVKGENLISIVALEQSGNTVIRDYLVSVPGTARIAGANRYEVSANISKTIDPYFLPDESAVIIARGDLYTDALSGGSLAGLEGGPILLSDYRTQSLPAAIQNEIKRLRAKRAIILGGTGSVSTNVENQLKSLGVVEIERIAGANRFDVSAKIAERVLDAAGGPEAGIDTAIVASGLVFPDALSASSPSGQLLLPILQVTKDNVPSEIDAFIQNHPYIKNFIIVGGPGTVSDAVKAKLDSYAASRGGLVDRIGGSNRYEVSANVARYFDLDPTSHVFAKGTDFPDALSGGPLAAAMGGPILLTPSTKVDPSIAAYLNEVSGKDAYYLLGGTASISTEVENQLKATLQ